MKLNLLLDNPKGFLPNYTNLDMFATPEDISLGRIAKHDVTNLNGIVENGEASEILARDVLCWFPIVYGGKILLHWFKKLKLGGKLVIEETDVEEVSRTFVLGNITIPEFMKTMYGSQKKDWDTRKSGLSLLQVVDFFKTYGAQINKKRTFGLKFLVEVERIN